MGSIFRKLKLLPVLALAGLLALPALAGGQSAGSKSTSSKSEAKKAPPVLPFSFGGPFELTSHTGKRVSDKDFRGGFALIYFGYTYCPNICPLDLANMIEGMDGLGDLAEKLTPVFVTIDPARDTEKVLAEYVANFHPRMVGLTGSETEIRKVAKAFRIHRAKVILEKGDDKDYLVSHSALFFLMGPNGKFLTLLPHGATPERFTTVLKKYLSAG